MAKQLEQLLANPLLQAQKAAINQIIKSEQLTRLNRERLIMAGYLQKIIRGWYLLCNQNTTTSNDRNTTSETTSIWHSNFWHFIRLYLSDRFANNYCLSPKNSLELFLGKTHPPSQIVVMATSGGGAFLELPGNISLLIYQEDKNFPQDIIITHNGINMLPFEYALCKMPPSFYLQQPQEAAMAFDMIHTPKKISDFLVTDGMAQAAGRIVGALKHLKKNTLADAIFSAMKIAGFAITTTNPFQEKTMPTNTNSSALKSIYYNTPTKTHKITTLQNKTNVSVSPPTITSPPIANHPTLTTTKEDQEFNHYSSDATAKFSSKNWQPEQD